MVFDKLYNNISNREIKSLLDILFFLLLYYLLKNIWIMNNTHNRKENIVVSIKFTKDILKDEEEMANVTKAEYENLIARVSQLTEIINRLIKK